MLRYAESEPVAQAEHNRTHADHEALPQVHRPFVEPRLSAEPDVRCSGRSLSVPARPSGTGLVQNRHERAFFGRLGQLEDQARRRFDLAGIRKGTESDPGTFGGAWGN